MKNDFKVGDVVYWNDTETGGIFTIAELYEDFCLICNEHSEAQAYYNELFKSAEYKNELYANCTIKDEDGEDIVEIKLSLDMGENDDDTYFYVNGYNALLSMHEVNALPMQNFQIVSINNFYNK